MSERCWLAQFSSEPCAGRLTKAHLILKQTIKREVLAHLRGRRLTVEEKAEQELVLWDERVWVPACELHHHALDFSRKLRIPRESLPAGLLSYAEEHGLGWWLAREYGALDGDPAVPTG